MRPWFILFALFSVLAVALPAAAQDTTYATAQRFENGVMIYRADTGTIYALAGAPYAASGDAWTFPSASYSRLPANTATPPGGLLAPEQGFGRVWANNNAVRGALGWATLPELGFEMGVTRTAGGELHLRQLDGTVYTIGPGGRWTKAEPRTPDDSDDVTITRFEVTPTEARPGDTITVTWEIDGDPPYRAVILNQTAPRYGRITSRELAATRGTATFTIPADVSGDVEVRLETGTFDHPGATGPTMTPYFLDSTEQIVRVSDADGSARVDAVYQRFENGFMIWRGDTGRVLTFSQAKEQLPNGFNGSFSYFDEIRYADWQPYTGDVPARFVAPQNAFSRVWNQSDTFRAQFGYPVSPEQPYTLNIRDGRAYSRPLGDGFVVDLGGAYWQYGD